MNQPFHFEVGDELTWKGFSKMITGKVIRREDDNLVVMTDEVHGFFVKDVFWSASLKVKRGGFLVFERNRDIQYARNRF